MEQIQNVGVEQIIINNPSWLSYKNEMVIIDFKENNSQVGMAKDERIRFRALSIILLLDGKIEVDINGNSFSFDSNVLFDTSELHTFSHMNISPNCRGYHIILTFDFLKEVMSGIKLLSISTFVSRRDYPIEKLTATESSVLEEVVTRIIKSIGNSGHLFHHDLVKNDLRSFFIEIQNIIARRDRGQSRRVLGNRNLIVRQFIVLLDQHCKREHSVAFYARELCVDAKYLSRIVKSVNGKTANRWIDEFLIKEAKLYLKEQKLPIQQIADILNFSDQSSFGKFFKKHCGVSPQNYRIMDQ